MLTGSNGNFRSNSNFGLLSAVLDSCVSASRSPHMILDAVVKVELVNIPRTHPSFS